MTAQSQYDRLFVFSQACRRALLQDSAEGTVGALRVALACLDRDGEVKEPEAPKGSADPAKPRDHKDKVL